ncbi:MAG: IS110 family transposase [Bacilli bacterium]|nr:IS110 family transposase [Bacilli bacterium]MBQ7277304.1 IS110 family transposase [Bacilli bacterium]
MKVIYDKACGVDVHKSFIVAVICDSTSTEPKYLRKRFSTFNNSLIQFRNWLIENDCQNVCMESTGKYYIPVYNALEGFISNVVVANPKWVAVIKGEKDDNKDAKWIADLFKLGIVRSSFIPPKDIRILREFTRYLYKLTCNKTSEKNRFTNALTVGNCKLDMVFTDIFGKSAQSIIDIVLNNDNFSDEDIISCLRKNCKSSHEDILSSVGGLTYTNEQKLRIKIVEDHINYLTNQINSLRDTVDMLVSSFEDYINLLMTIPGIDRNSAISILSEIGTDMSQFSNHYRLSSWAGLAPGCNESAGKKKSVKISRAGVYLKPYLIEVAHCAVKDKTNTYYANKFNKISKRRGKKRSYVAIARKILVAIYHMLSTGEVWNPTDLASNETNDKDRIKYTKNNFKQSLKQLLSLGLTSEELLEMINQNAILDT